MIGYTYGQQAYKLLEIEHQTIISSRHVTFNETRTIPEAELAPWNNPTVEGQWEGLLPEHLHLAEHSHKDDDDDGQHPPNPRPVGDQDIAQANVPEWPGSPIIQELAECLAQLHLDAPPAPPAIPAVPVVPAVLVIPVVPVIPPLVPVPNPVPAPAQVIAGVWHSG